MINYLKVTGPDGSVFQAYIPLRYITRMSHAKGITVMYCLDGEKLQLQDPDGEYFRDMSEQLKRYLDKGWSVI